MSGGVGVEPRNGVQQVSSWVSESCRMSRAGRETHPILLALSRPRHICSTEEEEQVCLQSRHLACLNKVSKRNGWISEIVSIATTRRDLQE